VQSGPRTGQCEYCRDEGSFNLEGLTTYFYIQAAEGTGLAFIVFTQAIVELPGAPFWAVLFFTMLLSLGLGSQIGILEGMLCTLFDIDIIKRVKKQHVTGVVCLFCFIVGFIFCTGAGEYWLKMFDSFAR